jgi:hypothetical protein
MSIQDEYTTVLRDELGDGYEAMAMAGLMKEYVKRSLKPKVLARRRQAVDNSALEIARAAKEKALPDEYASSADAAYWSRVESGSEKFSFAMWINLELGTGTPSLFTKYDGLGGQSEYLLRLTGNENFSILLADDVDNKFAARTTDAALSASVWHQIAITYDSGASGASVAANDITIYLDGAVIASTAANDADYSGMVAGTYAVGLGVDSTTGTPARFFDGKIAGGPCGPLFTHILLSADAIKRIFQLQRKPLGV